MLIKNEVLRFRLAGGERDLLDEGAKRLGLSVSEFVRDAALKVALRVKLQRDAAGRGNRESA